MSLVKGLYILRGNTAQPVSESPFSGDELASKDSFHFPVPNTTTLPAFPNLPPILQAGTINIADFIVPGTAFCAEWILNIADRLIQTPVVQRAHTEATSLKLVQVISMQGTVQVSRNWTSRF